MAGTISIVGKDTDGSKTDDVRLAAALLAVGCVPVFDKVGLQVVRLDRPGNWQEFYFKPVSRCGRYKTSALMLAWKQGDSWIENNPDHPFAYAMAAQANHRDLGRYLQQGNEYAFLKRGKSVAMLPMNASAGCEADILGSW